MYKVYYASGNPTALVFGLNKDKKRINDEILKENKLVEQVGFIDNNNYILEMAGGEFCGNATRCAIYYYLNGQDGNIDIKVNDVVLNGGIKNHQVYVEIPIINEIKKAISTINGDFVIKLNGITHVIVENTFEVPDNQLKTIGYEILKKDGLLDEKSSGVMFINRINGNIFIKPVVYVRDIDTLFFETACGSGTTAVGLYLSYCGKCDIDVNIIQPTNDIINVKVKRDKNTFLSAIISGLVKEI